MSFINHVPVLTYLTFFALITNKPPEIQAATSYSPNIGVGTGYSSDSQQITSNKCFNTVILSTAQQQGTMQLDTALSSSSLENQLGVTISASGSYLMFSADATANYLRSVKDKDYSLSLNYYEFSSNNVALQLQGYGESALTDLGTRIYNEGKNPYFLLLCGDHYITSYQQGALLTMSINIEFSSSEAKNTFTAKAGATFGSIAEASANIELIVRENKISGVVTIQAFQFGGEPSQLSKLLNKNENGQFYGLTCSFTAMDDCIKSASGLLDYAKEEFPKQFSFELNKGLAPLGIGFSSYSPIRYLGLSLPQSLVTEEIKDFRKQLSYKLEENEYYLQKLHPFINNGYPVQLTNDFVNNANKLRSKVKANINRLMQPHDGAVGCFDTPDECKKIMDKLMSDLKEITADDLNFLEPIKYQVTVAPAIEGGNVVIAYNVGEKGDHSWNMIGGDDDFQRNFRIHLSDKSYEWDINIIWRGYHYHIYFAGSSSDGIHYRGKSCYISSRISQCKEKSEMRAVSPYYFESFNKSS